MSAADPAVGMLWWCAFPALLCLLVLVTTATAASGGEPERARRVLMVHSFGSSAPPFTTHSTAFEAAIKRELGAAVDLDEMSLNMARYAQPDMEEAFADFLSKRMSQWKPDLVVPVGSPAGKFVAKYRDRLFPQTPIVYTGMDRRTLPADAFATDATFVGESFDFKGVVDDMLRLDPQTSRVVVILGATPLERYWSPEFQKAFAPFAGRITFTYVNDLSFEQMRDVVSKLPPHSFVLMGLLLRDASGVTYNADAALARLREVTRAPIAGLFEHQVGLGVVGGRLYQGELEGAESARIAARILRGEPASSFPPLVIGTGPPVYDARELSRWGFSERRLPPGSSVRFREPGAWQRYGWLAAGAIALIAMQALLIFAMLFQRQRRRVAEAARRRAEADAEQKRAELAHLSRVAALGELTAVLAHELSQPLTAILGNAEAGQMYLAAPKPDLAEVRDSLIDISADTARAGEVIQRLRAMLKRGAPEGYAPVDLNDLIRAVGRLVRGERTRHRVTLDLDLAADLPPTRGDAIQLQQVVMNLMLNAFAAMERPGPSDRRLVVRTRAVVAAGTSHLEAEFQDTGVGINADVIDRLFDPFVTTKPNGLGMGLSICRSILDQHGGRIGARNNPAGGATFTITLPLAKHTASAVTQTASVPGGGPKAKSRRRVDSAQSGVAL